MNDLEKLSYARGTAGFLFALAMALIGFNIDNSPTTYLEPPTQKSNYVSSVPKISLPPAPIPIDPPPSSENQDAENKNTIIETHLKRGETFSSLLLSQDGISAEEVNAWIAAIGKETDLRKLTPNVKIELWPSRKENSNNRIERIKMTLTAAKSLQASRDKNGKISVELSEVSSVQQQYFVSGTIETSFYQAAIDIGLPSHYLEEMILYYSFDVDFQRDIQKHDSFEILYEAVLDRTGKVIQAGKILTMSLTVNRLAGGDERRYFLYKSGGSEGFYDERGVSIEKALLKTPINGARLSSNYGYRKHPILGYTKLHKGVDFAAPSGTPIYAAGDGTVEYVGRNGSYGKYIRLRHGGSFKTAYAHLSGYAKAIKKGARVRQGQTIGYVGSTGRSTGPHLHYEIIQNDKAINPSKLKLPAGRKLSGDDLSKFKSQYNNILQLANSLRN